MSARYELLKSSDEDERSPPYAPAKRRRVALGGTLLALVGTLCMGFLWDHGQVSTVEDDRFQQCPAPLPAAAKPPAPINVWAPLTLQETTDINEWLFSPSRNLNLTRKVENSELSDNIVYLIESYAPNKADALAYLDDPSQNQLPQRYSRVTIHHGGVVIPVIKDYLVGPLPVGDESRISELKDIYHRDDIPFNAYGFTFGRTIVQWLNFILPEDVHAACDVRVPLPHHCCMTDKHATGLVRWLSKRQCE